MGFNTHHMGIHVSEEKERIVKEIEKFFTYILSEATGK